MRMVPEYRLSKPNKAGKRLIGYLPAIEIWPNHVALVRCRASNSDAANVNGTVEWLHVRRDGSIWVRMRRTLIIHRKPLPYRVIASLFGIKLSTTM